jgi:class II lanthipeptide synthase
VSPHRAQLAEAVRAIEIRSRSRFAWLGKTSPPLPRAWASALSDSDARAVLEHGLASRLYESFYCSGGIVPVEDDGGGGGAPPDAALVDAMSTANSGSGSWEAGWSLDAFDGDELVLVRLGVRVRARASECRGRAGTPRLGADMCISLPPALPALSPGFFTAVGDADLDAGRDDLIARLYFNVSCAGAPGLVAEVTSGLNRARVPFRLKVADHPERFGRCDAAVLYLRAADVHRRRELVGQMVADCASGLRPRTPAFTKRLAQGVGLGEERAGSRDSFGSRRCRIVAEGVVDAYACRRPDLRGRMLSVERHFADAGIDVDVPYLEAGSDEDYSLRQRS